MGLPGFDLPRFYQNLPIATGIQNVYSMINVWG